MRYIFLLAGLVFVGPLAFSQNKPKVSLIRLDPDMAVGGAASEYLSEITFVPMETTRESRFSDILQLEITDNFYVILDRGASAILVFTRQGRFHKRINTGEIIYQYILNRKEGTIEFTTDADTFVYDLNGKLVRKTKDGKIPTGKYGVSKAILDKEHTAYFNTTIRSGKDSLVNELLIYNNDKPTRYFLPFFKSYEMDDFDSFGFKNFMPCFDDKDSTVYYIHNYDYYVYQLTPHILTPVYQLAFPVEYSLPSDFLGISGKGKRMEFLSRERDVIVRLFYFYKVGGMLMFSVGKGPFVYSIRTRRLINLDKVVSDSSSYFLPVSPQEMNQGRLSILNSDGMSFYAAYRSQVLFSRMEEMKKKKNQYPEELARFFNNKANKDGNPVLIHFQLKSNF